MSMIFNGTNGLQFPDGSAQAESMTEYGIGVAPTPLAPRYNLNTLKKGGFYSCYAPTYTNSATLEQTINLTGQACTIRVEMYDSTNGMQVISTLNGWPRYYRILYSNTWYGWYKIWDSYSDGNGGQPPQKKAYAASVSANSGVATTIYAMSPPDKIYLCFAYLADTGIPSSYHSYAVISVGATGASRLIYSNNGSAMAITADGNAIKVTQGSGVGQTVYAKIQELVSA